MLISLVGEMKKVTSQLMLALLLSFSYSSEEIIKVIAKVKQGNDEVYSRSYQLGEKPTINCTENQTLVFSIKTSLKTKPKDRLIAMRLGIYEISGNMEFSAPNLYFAFTPQKLARLYKHSGKYSVTALYYADDFPVPVKSDLAYVNFQANNEVFDNFTDVEWDFQPPHPRIGAFKVKIFNILACFPIVFLVILLLLNGINFGYFPRNFFDAICSLAFIFSLGSFFAFFIYFWKNIHFEDMLKYLCLIVPVLGILLRGALRGRANMINNDVHQKKD